MTITQKSDTGKIDARTHMGVVALAVTDLGRSLDYYQQQIGLQLLDQDGTVAHLGTDERVLLELHAQPGAKPVARGRTGLYHFALLLPSRTALGQIIRHFAQVRTPVGGASDHGVSEALYLSDPDGHGIEIYRDRPRSEWPLLANGEVAMVTDPLDLPAIAAEPGAEQPWTGLPAATIMGHVHLHVDQLDSAESFYVDKVGFDLMQRFGGQASFISAGGYHHHLGMNLWAGVGAPPPPEDAARLLWYEIILPDAAALEEVLTRLRGAGVPLTSQGQGWLTHDPAHNAVILRV